MSKFSFTISGEPLPRALDNLLQGIEDKLHIKAEVQKLPNSNTVISVPGNLNFGELRLLMQEVAYWIRTEQVVAFAFQGAQPGESNGHA